MTFLGIGGQKGDANYTFRTNANIDIRCNTKEILNIDEPGPCTVSVSNC